jgi:phage shock protein C
MLRKAPTPEVYMTAQRPALRRSRNNRILAGVCGGLAEFFGIDSFWFRLGFVILLIPGGLPGLVPYIVMWIVIPSE